MIPRSVAAGIAVSMMSATMTLATTAPSTAASAAAAATTPTHFAMNASAYGTRVRGGDIPASSDKSAFQSIGCTNLAGLHRENHVAAVDLNPLDASTVRSDAWTTKRSGVVTSKARSRIAKVQLGSGLEPTIRINAIQSVSEAYHSSTGFHATTSRTIGSITLDPDGTGTAFQPVNQGLPTQGSPLEVGGLVRISVGPSSKRANASGASATADALRVKVLATSTDVYLAHSHAEIHAGVASGVFRGSSFGSRAKALDSAFNSKFTPFIKMPCQGTHGKIQKRDTARVDPAGLVVKGLTASQRSDQLKDSAYGWEQGRVARANIGNGDIVIEGIVGKANVKFVRGKGITTSIMGSHILSVTGTGGRKFGADDTIRVPGVALLERNVVKKTATSVEVTALRITLLGSGPVATIYLGHAKVGFRTSF